MLIQKMHYHVVGNRKKWTTIQAIAQNNDFPQTLIQRINYQIQRRHNNEDHINNEQQTKKTWATFTYYSPTLRKITNIFKHAVLCLLGNLPASESF